MGDVFLCSCIASQRKWRSGWCTKCGGLAQSTPRGPVTVDTQRRADDLACETAENTADMTTLDLAEQLSYPARAGKANATQVVELAMWVATWAPVVEKAKEWRDEGDGGDNEIPLANALTEAIDAALAKEPR